MTVLVSNFSKNVQSLPEDYVFPPDLRPGNVQAPLCQDIPLIDLSQERGQGQGRAELLQQIMKASQNLGIFQVINHGVPENLMDEAMRLFNEFFSMSPEEKAKIYSEDYSKTCRLYTSGRNYTKDRPNYWKDTLKHPCHPVEDHIQSWPEKPDGYREIVAKYSVSVRSLTMKILELLGEGLGIEPGYFEKDMTKKMTLGVNHYPRCPDPSSALGLIGHCDQALITVLQQSVYGLQILKDEKWFGVESHPHAFVVIVADQLEIISNGKLKSAHHRVVTNTETARTTIVNFTSPSDDCVIKPAEALINECNPPGFREFKYKQYAEAFMNKKPIKGNYTGSLDCFRLPNSTDQEDDSIA